MSSCVSHKMNSPLEPHTMDMYNPTTLITFYYNMLHKKTLCYFSDTIATACPG